MQPHTRINMNLSKFQILSRLLFAITLVLIPRAAGAANISVINTQVGSVIVVSGKIDAGDHIKFRADADLLPRALVVLASPGGNLIAGLKIGETIRSKGFNTHVPKGLFCASACGIAWLGGVTRYMHSAARVGFHAAYNSQNGTATETGAGNALVGAYYNSLGLSQATIYFLTATSPSQMLWLDISAARRVGIAVSELSERAPNRRRFNGSQDNIPGAFIHSAPRTPGGLSAQFNPFTGQIEMVPD